MIPSSAVSASFLTDKAPPLLRATGAFLTGAADDEFPPTSTVIVCPPPLMPIPHTAIDALETDAKQHSETGEFIVSLADQYDYQDACAARRG